jgi:hypothetical protein
LNLKLNGLFFSDYLGQPFFFFMLFGPSRVARLGIR